jgi:CubicO group peptidase (beta-lactamase class C family)
MAHYISLLLLLALTSAYDWTAVRDMVDLYHQNGAIPGGVLRVANSTHNLYTYEVGYMGKGSHVPFTQQTLFDIASLSKVSATLSSVIRLCDEGKINVNDPVIKYIPEYDNHDKRPTLL